MSDSFLEVEAARIARLRRRHAAFRFQISMFVLITYAVLLFFLAFIVAIDWRVWPGLLFVFALFVHQMGIIGIIRGLIRARRDRVVADLFATMNQEPEGPIEFLDRTLSILYYNHPSPDRHGSPPISVWSDMERGVGTDQVPADVLKRYVPIPPTPAEQRARTLLWSMLDRDQRREYRKNIVFHVPLPAHFRGRARIGAGMVEWPDGHRQCVHPTGSQFLGGSMPATDSIIAQLVHLRNNPVALRRVR